MKKLIAVFIIFFANQAFAESTKYYWKVEKVVDGDTIKVSIPNLPPELKVSIRIRGIDTPEKAPRAKCEREALIADTASEFTKGLIGDALHDGAQIYFTNISWDKYGGRILANVYVYGNDLGKALIYNGLAREYYGKKKSSWCK